MDASQFDGLDDTAGAVGCYHRMMQREHDGRWRVQYARATDGTQLLAVLPTYTPLAGHWADRAYDPGNWPFPAGVADGTSPGSYVLVGGNADMRSATYVSRHLQDGPAFKRLLTAVARAAAAENRGLLFPYVHQKLRELLDHSSGGRITWAPLGQEAHFVDALATDSEEHYGARIRRVLRRDRNLMEQQQVTTAVHSWPEIAHTAAEVIAQHNTRKGIPDHSEFVRMRYAQWIDCPSVELVVFTARAGGVEGVATALKWRDQLDVYEIALTGEESPERLATYVSLLFHQPVRFGRAHGLRQLRGGLEATKAKGMRGAIFKQLHGGVLSASASRELANRM
ncbi:hypothetical protein B7767_19765 [Streptomyces sp. 13-12-16]|nr:hypothetical protein B7767_19765 [Streptomyces sp. 13-12-16]